MPISHNDLPLNEFAPVSLAGISAYAHLPHRIEHKYLLHVSELKRVMEKLTTQYRILEIDGIRRFGYTSWYYDTAQFTLYHQHVTGKAYRMKVRQRRYDNSGTCYLEVKQKLGTGLTRKERISIDQLHPHLTHPEQQLIASMQPEIGALHHVATNCFNRITLSQTDIPERVTIDTGISTTHNGQLWQLPHIALIEIKQTHHQQLGYAAQVLRHMGLHSGPFSKYATSIAMLNKTVKYNNIKPTLLKLNKYDSAR